VSEGRFTYAGAGVSLEAADAVVGRLAAAVASTRTAGVVPSHGGYAGLFQAPPGEDVLLVAGTDSVGTKILLHRDAGTLHAAGIDCVAMCVNDVLCTGARPLFFLDYVGCGQLDPDRIAELVEGVADGCRRAGCALLGGETAEIPALYAERDVDLAGFAVGAVERGRLVDGSRVAVGDVLVGLAADGAHSNGFSLVRRLLAHHGIDPRDAPPGLLAPTAIYAPEVAALLEAVDVRALAHVTGGGIEGNLPRVLPEGLGARVDPGTWDWPEVFTWLQGLGVEVDEMRRVFNCGIGLIAVVPAADAERAVHALAGAGRAAWVIGRVEAGEGVAYA
jgi:phosphoribosylformylglycinamidine cyclo-ligase